MPSINMIAPRRAEKKRLERDIRRLMIVICLELVIGVVICGLLCARTYSTRNRIADLEVQLMKLQPDVRRIQSLQKMTSELEPKLVVLADAKDRTMHWYNLLDKLSRSLPEKTWVRTISSKPPSEEAASSVITFTGVSETQRLVGDTMMRLYANPDLDNVQLCFTQASQIGPRSVYEFQVEANLKTAQQTKKEVKSNGSQKS